MINIDRIEDIKRYSPLSVYSNIVEYTKSQHSNIQLFEGYQIQYLKNIDTKKCVIKWVYVNVKKLPTDILNIIDISKFSPSYTGILRYEPFIGEVPRFRGFEILENEYSTRFDMFGTMTDRYIILGDKSYIRKNLPNAVYYTFKISDILNLKEIILSKKNIVTEELFDDFKTLIYSIHLNIESPDCYIVGFKDSKTYSIYPLYWAVEKPETISRDMFVPDVDTPELKRVFLRTETGNVDITDKLSNEQLAYHGLYHLIK